MKDKKQRESNLDLMRCLALFLVVSAHFLVRNGFYQMDMKGTEAFLMCVQRTISMNSVPIFLMISGYLLSNRVFIPVRRDYFKRLIHLLVVYLVCTIIIIVFRTVILQESMTVWDMIKNILSFDQYSWYVAMYAGLYVLIPFLNVTFSNISGKDEIFLVIALCVLSAFPSVINIKDTIIPQDWIGLYPVTCYFLGAFIKRHKDDVRVKTGILFLIWLVCAVIFGAVNYALSEGGWFKAGIWNDLGSFENMVLSVLLFTIVMKSGMQKAGEKTTKFMTHMSGLVYPAFMLSYISDIVVWKIFKDIIPVTDKFIICIPAVILSFVMSLLMAAAVNVCLSLVKRSIG